jgi:glycosyltransferase involved in cell wall biosynthesis
VRDRRVKTVAHLVWRGEIGGIERLVRDLAAQQVRDGLDVVVAFGQAQGPFVDELRELALVSRTCASGQVGISDLRVCAQVRPSCALLTCSICTVSILPSPCWPGGRGPVVFTEHGNFGVARTIRPREKFKRRLQTSFLRRRVAGLAANSEHTADRLGALYGLDRSAVAVIRNGIDPSWLDAGVSISHRNCADVLRIAAVGRLVAVKRIDRTISVLAQARKHNRMQLLVVGRGPMEEDLRLLAASLGIDDLVRFLGDRVSVAETLAASDVLVQASESEAFGLAILEACAQGALPIVFWDAGGALEVIPPDGAVVDGVAELATLLDDLMLSPALEPEARRARAAWVRERFPISRTAERYAELYETAVGK